MPAFDPAMLAEALAAKQGGPVGPPAPSPLAAAADVGGQSPLMKLIDLLSAVAGIGGPDPMMSAPPPSL